MYELIYEPQAHKYLKKITEKGLKSAFRKALSGIEADPYIGQLKTGDLAGIYCYDVIYAGTNYEIAYRVYEEAGRKVVVILAGTRQNFYEQLKRYMNES
jgi:mRNA interferase RelE/StbE